MTQMFLLHLPKCKSLDTVGKTQLSVVETPSDQENSICDYI